MLGLLRICPIIKSTCETLSGIPAEYNSDDALSQKNVICKETIRLKERIATSVVPRGQRTAVAGD